MANEKPTNELFLPCVAFWIWFVSVSLVVVVVIAAAAATFPIWRRAWTVCRSHECVWFRVHFLLVARSHLAVKNIIFGLLNCRIATVAALLSYTAHTAHTLVQVLFPTCDSVRVCALNFSPARVARTHFTHSHTHGRQIQEINRYIYSRI